MPLLLFDLLLILLILVLAVMAMLSPRLKHAVTLFIAFGVMLALAWARLAAPDLALAEAAIGAGLTGALCYTALLHYGRDAEQLSRPNYLALGFCVLVAALLIYGMWQIPLTADPRLGLLVTAAIPESGVEHPVTAVLLNFRAWDTLLELLVLLLALLGARQAPVTLPPRVGWSLSVGWSRWLSPLILLLTAYILWRGAAAPGGAFQAGALLASGLVVLRLNEQLTWLSWQTLWVRLLVLSGLLIFTLAGLLSLFLQQFTVAWLTWPVALAGTFIFVVEAFATVAIAFTLTLLVVGEPESRRVDA